MSDQFAFVGQFEHRIVLALVLAARHLLICLLLTVNTQVLLSGWERRRKGNLNPSLLMPISNAVSFCFFQGEEDGLR